MMTSRTTSVLCCGLLFVACGCSAVGPRPVASEDCSFVDDYSFTNYTNFAGGDPGWFAFADPTPRGVPNPTVDGSSLLVQQIPAPGHCHTSGEAPGDNGMIELIAFGHNFYGAGFGDYTYDTSPAPGGLDSTGISFWARSPGDTDKTFMLYLDDGRTIVLPSPTDANGNPTLGPGDTVPDSDCRLPPPQTLGTPACYYGGALPPATATRVPEEGECGNQFHTYITTTKDWQLFLIPWGELAQWPCPNRLPGGINPTDIRQFEIKFLQGTSYDVQLDNISFYRPSTDGGN